VRVPENIIEQLNFLANKFNQHQFIDADPISIPHLFTDKRDIEIAGFIAATIAWGNRTAIVRSAKKIVEAMDYAPHQFITQHTDDDLKRFEKCGHRTFMYTDILYFIAFLKHHYAQHNSLESAFNFKEKMNVKDGLIHFHNTFFSLPYAPQRTRKHVSSPIKNSACKRLNMFLRWMVRKDQQGVDFGFWNSISPSELIMPLDVHVTQSVAKLFKLDPMKPNWKNAVELTHALKALNPDDPVVYDFALFGYGIDQKNG